MQLIFVILLTLLGKPLWSATEHLNIEDILSSRASKELIDPVNFYPSLLNIDPIIEKLLSREENCLTPSIAEHLTPQAKKLFLWVQFKCKVLPQLPDDFFIKGPYMHPLGSSWVMHAFKTGGPSFKGRTWLLTMLNKTHLLETRDIFQGTYPEGINAIFADLEPDQLKSLLAGELLIETPHFLLKRTSSESLDYQIENASVSRFLNSNYFLLMVTVLLVFLLVIIVWLGYRLIQSRKQYWADKELMMQTIAHELRHPVTSLQLSLEVYRNAYDVIPSDAQLEFLRMSSQVQRLYRIIHASGQYLRASQQSGESFQFRKVLIPSLNDFFTDILVDHLQKLEIQVLSQDASFTSDPYWLSVCITNLVKNALIHGQPPVELIIQWNRGMLNVEVTDHGFLEKPLSEIMKPFSRVEGTQGLGLGLSIVNRIVTMMGGKLTCSHHPTRFCFYVKDLSYEKTAAS